MTRYTWCLDELAAVDILAYPNETTDLAAATTATFGDLHGNACKFFFVLTRYRFLLPTAAQYRDLMTFMIPAASPLSVSTAKRFSDLLAAVPATNQGQCRLLGDVLAERGANDFFTLAILDHWVQQGGRLQILLSNHDIEFLLAYQANFQPNLFDEQNFFAQTLNPAYSPSLQGLLRFVTQVPEPDRLRTELMGMVRRCYLPYCQLAALEELTEGGFMIFSHAPNPLHSWFKLAATWGLPTCSEEEWGAQPERVTQVITSLNAHWQQRLGSQEAARWFTTEMIPPNSLFRMCWTRDCQSLAHEPQPDYPWYACFGHVGDRTGFADPELALCLDTHLGKVYPYEPDILRVLLITAQQA